ANPGKIKEKKKNKESKELPKASLLSFQDEEEETEEVFKVKKSSYSKKIVKQLKKEYKEDLEKNKVKPDGNSVVNAEPTTDKTVLAPQEDPAGNSEQGEEEMEVDSDNQEEEEEDKTKSTGAFANAISSLSTLRPGEIPDAAFIHAARKRRQMARELGDGSSTDLEMSKGRLVREDENDASDDDDEKRRIVFSVKEKSQRQKIAEEIVRTGIEGSDDEALATGHQDEELNRWEQEQIRKGISIPQVQTSPPMEMNNMYYQNTYQAMPYGSSYGVPYTYAAYGATEAKPLKAETTVPFKATDNEMTPVTIDLVKKRLKERPKVSNLQARKKKNRDSYLKNRKKLTDKTRDVRKLESKKNPMSEYITFSQSLDGEPQYCIQLCYILQVPLINELESAMYQLLKQRAARLVQRRQDDIKDESSEYSSHSSKALVAPNLDTFGRDRSHYQEHAKVRRIAEREARRTRRRQAREQTGKMAEHHEGISSDDEETSTDITNFNMEQDRILKESKKVFEDVLEDFYSIDCIKFRFEAWRKMYLTCYQDAYIGLCLSKLFNPLIRLQLITWNPLEVKCSDFENMMWFESLLFYGCEEEKAQQKDDVDVALLPAIIEKVIVAKLTGLAEHIWDPLSTSQTSRFITFLLKLIQGYPSVVNAENRSTQALLKAIVLRIRKSLDDDVFIPLYPKNVLENKNSGPYLFFQRQFWSSVKLMNNILQWHGILSNRTLLELAVDSLLNRYILLALQISEPGEDSIKKSQSVILCFPKQWFTSLKGEKTIPHLENFCRYLVHLANAIYRISVGCSDVEKRNARDQIKQVIKCLASIHALDHAVALANEYSVKDIKALIEGK
uniref:PAX3 and PAX7 binding protein 1 n=1 Tax=Latimeria chalumnae TaxID=7897 RepID=H3AI15_LATCH